MSKILKICFLASGGGGNLKFLHLAKEQGLVQNIELSVIADRECGSVEFAKNNKIKSYKINYSQKENKELLESLNEINPDIIVTNWHKIIDPETVNKYEGRLINLHYSLLPAFDGLIGIEPLKQAYERNCKYVGATCHYVDEGVDTGKIISQAIVKANIPFDIVVQEVFQKCCIILLNSIAILSKKNIVSFSDNSKFEYSPNLVFDDSCFEAGFWNKLSNL